ncbi:MAG TPA: methylated-DNA--[protein]-cysteine S-methyltransferase [Verrucomicrobiota bacterium]|nr:methylated-DNA--[protein]-cysteine S-methyltransferase [candidate division Zixibacteria bacterium]MDD4918733.1 methylated-DNA--[protein]-cysteine S-methyltransferase [candidate division Zixibacteria bacterium]HOB99573.1 methylated-DNA--[protein]-cysteine S-methyltransferase [Verrucomicrobiota bacterium]HOY57801.1 methylated-DNA--[protein]-cysteine S-methyltransferase [Verrucomicrobiota bacterium]HPM38557.1 methylated-DNA--[protein]-cysteine S-methyltransferase [candidate division Zixibacteri
MADSFHERVIAALKRIPKGRVATYGQIAALAGNPRAARQVVRALNTSSRTERLPWHRVINAQGRIALPRGGGFEMQQAMLRDEGVVTDEFGCLDLAKYQWRPRS